MDLTITSEPADDGVLRLHIAGAIDLASRDELFGIGTVALDGASALVLNLAAVHFMDSTGLGVLIDLAREARDRGAGFALEQPSQRVLKILTLTGLREEWPVITTPDGAVERPDS